MNNGNNAATVDVATMRLRPAHYLVIFTCSLGQIIGTALATIVGIVIPLMQIVGHPELSAGMQGLIGCANLIGIAVGSPVFGKIADRYGYLGVFRLCPTLILVAAVVSVLVPSLPVLLVCLFVMGFGIGGEYSLDSGYTSELMPARLRSVMVGVVKAGCALGNIAAAGLCYAILSGGLAPSRWSTLMWIIAGIAALMLLTRVHFAQSPM
ncbi:MAG: MFS transporter, partial [Muribaculaceae bacterium]|nr:MFS transporter [Muribaculaceae bacterium]